MDLNRVTILGNATGDPVFTSTEKGDFCAFTVATNISWKDRNGNAQQKTEYHKVVTFGKLATICGQRVHKGMKLYVEGKLQTHQWEKDGQKNATTEINADNVIFVADNRPNEEV